MSPDSSVAATVVAPCLPLIEGDSEDEYTRFFLFAGMVRRFVVRGRSMMAKLSSLSELHADDSVDETITRLACVRALFVRGRLGFGRDAETRDRF
jgi:hypothetical protein